MMGKAVLISIRPKWCKLIASGRKTMELRTRVPVINPPYKCYIYETIGNERAGNAAYNYVIKGCGRGKVIGEFVCEYVLRFCHMANADIAEQQSGVRRDEIYEFSEFGKKEVKGMHISDLVIYDEPKELSDFRSWNTGVVFKDGYPMPTHEIKRPPQSWMYVEELT